MSLATQLNFSNRSVNPLMNKGSMLGSLCSPIGVIMNQEEIWKDIEGYKGLYKVSSTGRVKSLKRFVNCKSGSKRVVNEKILKNNTSQFYEKVVLNNLNVKSTRTVHRLVAEAFVSKPTGKDVVNHINEIKTDNRACNLEWMTNKENTNHGNGLKKRAESQRNDHRSKKVIQKTLEGDFVKLWPSQSEAGRNGFTPCNIGLCCRGRIKSHRGFKWEYKQMQGKTN